MPMSPARQNKEGVRAWVSQWDMLASVFVDVKRVAVSENSFVGAQRYVLGRTGRRRRRARSSRHNGPHVKRAGRGRISDRARDYVT